MCAGKFLKVVVKARDVIFLLSSPLHLPTQDDDDDPTTTQQLLEQSNKPVPANTNQLHKPVQVPVPPMTIMMTQQPVPTLEPSEHLVVRLPRRYMNRPSTQHLSDHEENDVLTLLPAVMTTPMGKMGLLGPYTM